MGNKSILSFPNSPSRRIPNRSRHKNRREGPAVDRALHTKIAALRHKRKARRRFSSGVVAALGAAAFAAGCTVGPNYVKPKADVPAAFVETPENWKQAQP